MKIGASSACFYPLETEKALLKIARLGFTDAEIFFNSRCELERSFINELKAIRDFYGINITSLHPYCSFSEGYNFFSRYERRFHDGAQEYKKLFEAAAILGAPYIVLHGSRHKSDIPMELYAERYNALNELAISCGCMIAHENVVNYISESPQFMRDMKNLLGDSFRAVLDVKQARRTGIDPQEFISALDSSIVHVHLSDYNAKCDCIPPDKKGFFDFEALFTSLKAADYEGKYIVELYSDNFSDEAEISASAKYLEDILNKIR